MFNFESYCLDGEVWKEIPGYEGIYEASNLGRIRSVDGKKTHSDRHGIRTWKGRILKNKTKTPSNGGYKVTLWKNKKCKDLIVARLVCMAFHGVPENFNSNDLKLKMTVNHKDGNRFNNNIDNLEWLTIKDNIKHGFENDLFPQIKVVLVEENTGEAKTFRSLSIASRYLGKNTGYLSLCLKENRKIYDKSGNKYFAKKI